MFLVVKMGLGPVSFSMVPELAIERRVEFDGQTYTLIESALFFEWLFSSDGEVIGVESLVPPDSEVGKLLSSLADKETVSFEKGSLRLLFSGTQMGITRNLQDWEDYYYYNEVARSMLICYRLHFLSQTEINGLRKRLAAIESRGLKLTGEADESAT